MSAGGASIQDVRAESRRALLDLLDAETKAGRVVPCRAFSVSHQAAWTSDVPAEQAAAAKACGPCPSLTACAAYGVAWPREAGVYGGLTEQDRRRAAKDRKGTAA